MHGIFQVWNPAFDPDSVSLHAETLIKAWQEAGRKRTDAVFAWWGKIGREGRPGAIAGVVEGLQTEARTEPFFLFLTNYRTVHACLVDDICHQREGGEIVACPCPGGMVPEYYARQHARVLYWFRLRDILILEEDLLPSMECLGGLTDSQGRPLDLYSSRHYEYPIPVTVEPDGGLHERLSRYLDTQGDELHAARSLALPKGVYRTLQTLMQDLAPGFGHLPRNVRTFLADGKFNYELARDDYSSAVLQLSKAYEVMIRQRFIPLLRDLCTRNGLDAPTIAMDRGRAISLREYTPNTRIPLASLLKNVIQHRLVRDHVPEYGVWLHREFAPTLLKYIHAYRNPAAHEAAVPLEDAEKWHAITFDAPDTSHILHLERCCRSMAPS